MDIDFVRRGQFVRLARRILQEARRARGWGVSILAQPAKETLRSGLSFRPHSSLSRPTSSNNSYSSRNLRACPCSSRRQSGRVVALGRDLLLNASPRTPGIQSGDFYIVWARGKTRLFDIWSFKGNSLLPLLAAALSSPDSLVRGLSAECLLV